MGNKQGNKIIKKTKIEKEVIQTKEIKNETIQPKEIDNTYKEIYEYDILFIGETGIGTKTSLIKRIKEGKFTDNIGNDKVKREKISYIKENKKIILYLIDTNAKEYKKILEDQKLDGNHIIYNYYKFVDCIIMGYDIINKQSFEEIKSFWYNKIKEKNKTIRIQK